MNRTRVIDMISVIRDGAFEKSGPRNGMLENLKVIAPEVRWKLAEFSEARKQAPYS